MNLDPSTSQSELLEAFQKHAEGTVRARLVLDKETGASKGAAFIDFGSNSEAQKAVQNCQNIEVGNKRLFVQMARQI